MNNEFYEIVDTLTEKKASSFLTKTISEVNVKTDISQVVKDTTWIDKLEESIPFIDNIIRNPRKFIVSEEEMIPVEKTKKVTEESIKHLAKHTSLIQDVDENGDVMPLKLLNVFKEETTDLYENRFIYSLVVNTKVFLNDYLENNKIDETSKYIKTVNYNGETKLLGEKINIKVEVKNYFAQSTEEEVVNTSLRERIESIVDIFDDFLRSQFIKSLTNVVPVRSPIRKTNVILKDQNFIKALELWEFIETFDIKNSTKIIKNTKEEDSYNLDEKLKASTYLQYNAISNVSKRNAQNIEYKLGKDYLKKAIETYVSENHANERVFRNMLITEFKSAKNKKEKEYLEIKNEFKCNVENHKKRLKDSLSYLN